MKLALVLTITIPMVSAVKRMTTVVDYLKKNPDFVEASRKRRKLQGYSGNTPAGFGVHPEDRLTCDIINEAFQTGEAWADSACACRTHDSFSLTATCIDQFECCSQDGVCVTNSFQQVIDTETYEALDTMEYFHYTQGRVGTVTLYHLCESAQCSCSLHSNTDRCDSCQLIECDGEENPEFDCTNIPGGTVFNFCPSSSVHGLDTNEVIGVLEDGYIDFENNCKPLPGAVSANITNAIGHLHELVSEHRSPAPSTTSFAFVGGLCLAVSSALMYMMI